MLEINPIADKHEQETLCRLCGIEYREEFFAYKAYEDGKLFAVSARCPHLGCQLEWNPDEKSWECPCHGSRFNYLGELISGPAQDDLEHESSDLSM